MEQQKAPGSPAKGKGNPPLRRGQIRNKIIMDFLRSLAAIGHPGRMMNRGGGGSGTTTPTSSSAYNSDSTSDA